MRVQIESSRSGRIPAWRVAVRLLLTAGLALVSAPHTSADEFRPYQPQADREERKLPAEAVDVAVGGGGRYLVLHLPRVKALAMFDAGEGKVTKFLPLAEHDAKIAAGQSRVVVLYPASRVLEIWNLAKLERERRAPFPTGLGKETVGLLALGSASEGPLFLTLPQAKRTVAVNLTSLEASDVGWQNWGPSNAWGPANLRVSPDGSVLVGWWGGWAGVEAAFLKGGRVERIKTAGAGPAVPSLDGWEFFSTHGILTRDFAVASPVPVAETYLFPAHEPAFFLALKERADHLWTFTRDGRRLHSLTGLCGTPGKDELPPEKRIHYYPVPGLLVTLPAPQKDRLVLHRMDLDAGLEKSGTDYLLVVSRPPVTAARNKTFSYALTVKSRKGGVKYKLESGPDGMRVSPDGRLTWNVPKVYRESPVGVILSLTDASGQEVFHAFRVVITD